MQSVQLQQQLVKLADEMSATKIKPGKKLEFEKADSKVWIKMEKHSYKSARPGERAMGWHIHVRFWQFWLPAAEVKKLEFELINVSGSIIRKDVLSDDQELIFQRLLKGCYRLRMCVTFGGV